jgi:hypothetical protein
MKIRHLLVGIALVGLATSAAAAPPIAYATAGNGGAAEVWLINPDGTGAVRVYQGPKKFTETYLTVSPVGGQVAFVETDNISFAIKVVKYNSAGVVQSTTTVPQPAGCKNYGLDSRADGMLLFTQACNRGTSISIKSWDGALVKDVITNIQPSGAWHIRWLPDGSGFLWEGNTDNAGDLRRSSIDNPSSWTVIWQYPYGGAGTISSFDIAHQSNAFLVSFGSQAEVQRYEYDFTSVSPSPTVLAAGQEGHYSPDDSQIIYRTYTKQGYKLVVKDLASGATKTIADGVRASWGGRN